MKRTRLLALMALLPALLFAAEPPPSQRGAPPAKPAGGKPEAETTWPPTLGSGDWYGGSDTPFGSKPFVDTPFSTEPTQTTGLFRPNRLRQKLEFSGYADLGLTFRSVSGASGTFSQDQYGKDKFFSENASLLITGAIWKWANLNVYTQIEQRSFGFNDTRPVWRIFWEDQHTRLTFGDIQPSVGDTNEFVPFSRRLTGLEAVGRIGNRFEYLLFGSQVGGSVRTQTFAGNGTAGPYYLTYVPIVDGSALVVVDGVLQQAGYGDSGDYTLNPSTGELMFNGTRIIAPTSKIEVRYETQSSGGAKDFLTGGQMRWSPTNRLRLGFQYLAQLSGTKGGTQSVEERVTDTITVPTPSNGPFTIRPRPIVAGSEAVQVNGILKVRDVDYQIAYESGELRFFEVLPEGTTILVRFNVIQAVDLGAGDRTVLGFDGSLTAARWLNVTWALAQSSGSAGTRSNPYSFTGSSLGNNYISTSTSTTGFTNGLSTGTTLGTSTGTWNTATRAASRLAGGPASPARRGLIAPMDRQSRDRQRLADQLAWDDLVRQRATTTTAGSGGGTAYKLGISSQLGGLQTFTQIKQVTNNFSRIDSTGFTQNERGVSFTAQYAAGSAFSIGHQMDFYTRPYFGTDGTVTAKVRAQSMVSSLSWRFLKQSSLTLTRNAQSNGGGGSSNDLARETLSLTHRFSSQLQFTGGIDHASSGTTGTSTTTTSTVSASNTSNTFAGRLGLGYNTTGGRFGARFDYSFSNTRASSTRNAASSLMAAVNYQPFRMVALQASWQLSDSRNTSTVGRLFTRVPTVGTVEYLLYRLELDRLRRQAGVGAFDTTGTTSVATDPLTGQVIGSTLVQNSTTNNTSFSVLLTPSKRLSITNNLNFSTTDNGRLAGSTSTSFQTSLHYQISERIGLNSGYSLQDLRYTDSGDSTGTSIINFGLDWRLSNHFDLRADFQTLGTSNRYGSSTTTDTTSRTPDTSYTSFGLDSRWQLPGRAGHSWSASFRSDHSTGSESSRFNRNQLQSSLNLRLTSIVGLSLSYTLTDYHNAGTTNNSYTAHLFSAGLGARF